MPTNVAIEISLPYMQNRECWSIFKIPMVKTFMGGLERVIAPRTPWSPVWNLNVVFTKLMSLPYEQKVTEMLRHRLDRGDMVALILLDLSAAFDTVSIKSLQSLGISGPALAWLTSFLSNRTFQVFPSKATSKTYSSPYGVPKALFLAHYYLMFISDLWRQLLRRPGCPFSLMRMTPKSSSPFLLRRW